MAEGKASDEGGAQPTGSGSPADSTLVGSGLLSDSPPRSAHPRLPLYARVPTLQSLAERDWCILWLAGHLWHLAFWMELLVLGWVTLELTDSPLLVSLVGTFRLAPLGILGFFAGSLADRLSKRGLLMVAQVVNIAVTVGFTAILALGLVQAWHVYVAAILTGSAWAIDFPVRRAFIRDLLPERAIVNAMALDAASLTGSAMVGRWLAGGLLALASAAVAYGLIALCYLLGFVILLMVPGRPVHRAAGGSQSGMLRDLKEGLSYAWRNLALRGVLVVTVFVNFLVFPYFQLTPVFARDIFGVGPAALGLMSGMDGLGALIGTVALASLANVQRRGMVFIAGTLLLSLGVFLFSVSGSYLVAMPMLLVAGLGMSGFATMQTTITVTAVDPTMRGRAMGALALAIGLLPLGMLYIGAIAEWLGAPMAIAANSLVFIVILLAIAASQPGLRRIP